VGSVPVLGDFFDIAWRANRRNYALLTGSVEEPEKHVRRSWLFFGVLCVVLLVLLILPMLIFAWVSVHVLQGVFGFDVHTAAPHFI
jgi:type II secretory pathway component PulL